jgi:hypothetical protein
MIATISKFIQSSAFGFASFCKQRYLAKVDRNVKTYNTKCIDGFVTFDMQFEWIPDKIICWCYNKDYKDFKYVVHTSCECPGIFCFNS